jgi:hypothetical protein
MGRQLRNKRAGEKELYVASATGTSKATISNYGITRITSTGGNYVLDAPVEGVRKTIMVTDATTGTNHVVYGSTDGAATVTFDAGSNTILTFQATVDCVVDLVGVSSTRWVITNVRPENLAVNTTGVVAGTT